MSQKRMASMKQQYEKKLLELNNRILQTQAKLSSRFFGSFLMEMLTLGSNNPNLFYKIGSLIDQPFHSETHLKIGLTNFDTGRA